MQPTTNSLIMATRKASKLLLRDFFELEMLQNSTRGTLEFCNKSFQRTKILLKEELQKNYKHLVFGDEKLEIPQSADIVLLIQPIEGFDNLSKSLNFFSIMITCLKKINNNLAPTNSIMIFPALQELYYAEKGGGAWFEKNSNDSLKAARLRISSCISLDNAFIASNSAWQFLKKVRITGSFCYDLSLFIAGKLDAIYTTILNPILKPGFELFITEAGGFCMDYDNYFIASNQKLAEKIKQLHIKSIK